MRAKMDEIGLRLGDLYNIGEIIGRGGFATVRGATHKVSQTEACVKAVLKATAGGTYKEYIVEGGAFEMVMKMSLEHQHRNIVRYFDILESTTRYYIVMERLEVSLAQVLVKEGSGWSERKSAAVMSDLLTALHHLHMDVGVYHRDVKLENLGFRGKIPWGTPCEEFGGACVLFDFGLARFIDQKWDGEFAGTPLYLAPEVQNELKAVQNGIAASSTGGYSCAVDLWAAGIVLFVLLLGDFPVDEDGEPRPSAMARFAKDQGSPASGRLLEILLQAEPCKRMDASIALQEEWLAYDGDQLVVVDYETAVRKSAASGAIPARS
jgi:serine/threonine protein kinase